VNQTSYVETFKRLREAVRRKGPEYWPNDGILQYDSAPAHKTLSATQFLAQKLITEMEHPFYSPHLAPNVFWLFLTIKSALKGQTFQDTEDIQKWKKKKVTKAPKAVP